MKHVALAFLILVFVQAALTEQQRDDDVAWCAEHDGTYARTIVPGLAVECLRDAQIVPIQLLTQHPPVRFRGFNGPIYPDRPERWCGKDVACRLVSELLMARSTYLQDD